MIPLVFLFPLALFTKCVYLQSPFSFLNTSPLSIAVVSSVDTPILTSSGLQSSPNTQPCNGYVELCDRNFSNVSMVVAHNSPFVKPHNAASNQAYPVLTQLQDRIRGCMTIACSHINISAKLPSPVQFETHMPTRTSSIHLCHTSCSILNAGPLTTYLSTVKTWLDRHPTDIITIMLVNNPNSPFRIPPSSYALAFQESGIAEYIYTPSTPSMNTSDWPTLGEMTSRNTRVVVMLDYNANQIQVPWLLDEWNYQWETAFSPTDASFPCLA
jgi:hypothetical protein